MDPAIVRLAISRFAALSLTERSAVILKDVLGHSLNEIAETMSTTVLAVKAALVRGRGKLRDAAATPTPPADDAQRVQLERYATLFNARDWDGVRALIGDDCRLDLVTKSQRRGKAVGMYFERYELRAVRVAVASLEGRLVLAAFENEEASPRYFILIAWRDGRVESIRDFRFVPYIAADAELAV